MAADPAAGAGAATGAGATAGTTTGWAALPLDASTRDGLHGLVADVVALGGAVGWLQVPPPEETSAWAQGLLESGARLLVVRDADEVVACGAWRRPDPAVLRQNGEIFKVMVRPTARGRGLARLVVSSLVRDADEAGVELLTLDARGNNHAALDLYSSLGFVVTGRRPDAIAVGQERFDQLLLHLDLRTRRPAADPPLVRRGGRRQGSGRT